MRRIGPLLLALIAPLLCGADAPRVFGHMRGGRPCRWGEEGPVWVRWHVRPGVAAPGVSRDEVRESARRSFAAWGEVAAVAGVEVDGEAGANVVIDAAGLEAMGHPRIVAAVCTYPCSARDRQVDLLLDSGDRWDAAKLRKVMLHEVGHSLGLGHHDGAGSVMGPDVPTHGDAPSADDVAGLVARYGPPRSKP